MENLFRPDQQVPQRLKLFPSTRISEVTKPRPEAGLGRSAAPDGPPSIEVAMRAPVARCQLLRRKPLRLEIYMAGVVLVPVVVLPPILRIHAFVERSES